MSQRIAFAGTREFAAIILKGLLDAGQRPVAVYTRPDKTSGRGRKVQFSEVKTLALAQDLPIYQPRTLRAAEAQAEFAALKLDLFIVAAYGLILPLPILDAPRLGCLNVHASLLPRWRGAAPIERAIMAGDAQTGVCLMQMEEGLDTGPVFASASVAITDSTTGPDLTMALAELGARELTALLPVLEQTNSVAQDDALATYADKLTDADATPDWSAAAVVIDRQVRALCERQPVTAHIGELQVKLLQTSPVATNATQPPGTIEAATKKGIDVATGDGLLRITQARVNRGKGSVLRAADLLNGYGEDFAEGTQFVRPESTKQ